MIDFKHYIARNVSNIPGWRTLRKIVVIESDDWGSIRMPSREIYDHCLAKGYRVDLNPYSRYDSLASSDDLDLLFNLLSAHRDCNRRTPVITANCLVANPDFKRIRESKFTEYFFETIDRTFTSYPHHGDNLEKWKKASSDGLFFLQSHGREHLNVSRFIRDLGSGDPDAKFAFDLRMPGIFKKNLVAQGNPYVEANEHVDSTDLEQKIQIVSEGLELFKKLFQTHSRSFIACNYKWHPALEKKIMDLGVLYIQGMRNQLIPKGNLKGFTKRRHFTGQRNSLGQVYLVRNAPFEPFSNGNRQWVETCLRDIATAFRWRKPAIISAHRANFVGHIDTRNRDRSLSLLNELLSKITDRWPMVEFMTSAELGQTICTTKGNG